jgi:hypothetical protein
MQWFVLLPIALAVLVVSSHFTVSLFVERAERQRRRRHPARRQAFRPVLIQGGKAQAPPKVQAEAKASRSA